MKYLFLIVLFHLSCGEDSDRQEAISKIRGLGMNAVPLVSAPSTASAPLTVDLRIFVAHPNGESISFETFTDQPTNSALLLDKSQYTIVKGSETTAVHNAFSITSFRAIANVPKAEQIPAAGGKVRVGFLIKGKSNVERFIGNFLVVPSSNTTLLAWKAPLVDINSPKLSQTVAAHETVNVLAVAKDFNGEALKAGWFVSAGEITNRRSIDTYWKTPKAGAQTIVITVRGKRSLGFAMQVRDLTTK